MTEPLSFTQRPSGSTAQPFLLQRFARKLQSRITASVATEASATDRRGTGPDRGPAARADVEARTAMSRKKARASRERRGIVSSFFGERSRAVPMAGWASPDD